MTAATRTRLEAVTSDAACLAGYGEMNAGRMAETDGWFSDALRLARHAGDRRLEALALVGCAWIPYHQPDPDRGKVVAALEAAAGLYRYLPPAARAYVFAYLACERAVLGDDLVSGRFLEHARDAVALIPYEGPGWGWWSTKGELTGWDGVRPQVFTGTRSSSLGRPAEALELFDGALEGTTLPVRRSHLYQEITDVCVGLITPTGRARPPTPHWTRPRHTGSAPSPPRSARSAGRSRTRGTRSSR